jgi:hypothetical protein
MLAEWDWFRRPRKSRRNRRIKPTGNSPKWHDDVSKRESTCRCEGGHVSSSDIFWRNAVTGTEQ